MAELEQSLKTSLGSNTIEWSLNLRICDMLQANPSLAPHVMKHLDGRLRKENPVKVMLALSLLEMVVKNCGIVACRFIDNALTDALVCLVRKREGWRYSIGRNLHKSFGGWLPSAGISEAERRLWLQVTRKVLEMMQLWADAFLLQEGELQPVFLAYKQLRQEGIRFPRGDHGTSTGLCLVQGAEESPAYLAGAGNCTSVAEDVSSRARTSEQDTNETASASATPMRDPAASSSTELLTSSFQEAVGAADDSIIGKVMKVRAALDAIAPGASSIGAQQRAKLHEELLAARSWATRLIQEYANGVENSEHLDETQAEVVIILLDDLSTCLDEQDPSRFATSPSSSSSVVPPPPSQAPPDQEQQEYYDLILAQYLQEKENEAFFANEQDDAAMALRLAMEEELGSSTAMGPSQVRRPSSSSSQYRTQGNRVVSCMACGTANRLPSSGATQFVCYACNTTQGLAAIPEAPPAPVPAQAAPRPTRHAPPPRVICTGDAAPELLIGGDVEEEPQLSAKKSRPEANSGSMASLMAAAVASATPAWTQQEAGSGGAMSAAGESLLGAPVGKPAKSWTSSGRSWTSLGISSSTSQRSRTLGDGTPSAEYAELGDESAPLSGGGPPASRDARQRGGFGSSLVQSLRGRRTVDEENEAPLLSRVRVDEEWELIRPTEARPYWHNSVTQVSQWEPPAVVLNRGGN